MLFFCDERDVYVGHVALLRWAAAVDSLLVDLLHVRAGEGRMVNYSLKRMLRS